jgi:hypothetical protein
MWICKCGKKNVDSEDSCWNCGVERSAAEVKGEKGLQPASEKLPEQETDTEYVSAYGATRMAGRFVSFVGWVLVVVGALGLIIIIATGVLSRRIPDLMQLLFCLGGVMGGLLLVLAGQLTRAAVDTADNTGEMLFMMKRRRSK